MSAPTIALRTIKNAWRDALKDDADILAFCMAKYGIQHKIFVGINLKEPPTIEDCPYIVIGNMSKVEGEDEEQFLYTCMVGCAVKNATETVTGNVTEQAGFDEIDEFCQLVYSKLVELRPSNPVSRVDYSINVFDFYPQLIGEMELLTVIEPPIGAALSY